MILDQKAEDLCSNILKNERVLSCLYKLVKFWKLGSVLPIFSVILRFLMSHIQLKLYNMERDEIDLKTWFSDGNTS
ncbi:hypothetical protein T4D_1380 [Trichinella pseudospiralis]|uniref:Uncharacterized protein n=1 Tax=Trichinella pseudospiralis TaxID=6337 RepID=A0A0V1DR04_TRIPS|nr:hypothetical protein T4D_1380 [Trichinella pseudospiralis]